MNYLDIYKVLPRTNCGKCGMPTCMAFSLNAFRGQLEIGACPYIDRNVAEALTSRLKSSDWRKDLVVALGKEVSAMDFDAIAEGIGARVKRGCLRIRCLGIEFIVTPEGDVITDGHQDIWMKVLLLQYVRAAGNKEFRNEWISFGELRGGMVKESSFKRECEDPLHEIVDRDIESFEKMIFRIGGKRMEAKAADCEWIVYPLPRVPFRILYWKADNEFDSSLKVLVDKSADAYLDVESYIFLGEGLVEKINKMPLNSSSSS